MSNKIISGYIFSDNFTGELVSAKDIDFGTAPPERYIKIIRHPQESLYHEKWTVKDSDNLFVNVSCAASRYWDKEYGASFYRRAVENQHNIKLGRMVHWYVPASVFDKWVSDYNLTPVQDLRCVGDIVEIETAMEYGE